MLLQHNFLFSIEILLQAIVERYLTTSYCVTVIYEKPIQLISALQFRYIKYNDSIDFFSSILDASETGCSDYIVGIREPQRFMKAFDKVVHIGNTRRSDRKLIFFPHLFALDGKDDRQKFLDVLKMKESKYIANILIVLPSVKTKDCDIYELFTHKFVGLVHDQAIQLDIWNSCSAKFEKNADLFPIDISNLRGKVVRVSCFTYKPYVLLDLDSDLVPNGRTGVEMKLVDEFCRWVNCTVELVRADEEEWGIVYENFTGLGVLGNLVEDDADIGITALYSWYEAYLYMDFSIPCIRTAITCIAPSPRLLASWTMPLLPFTIYMWIGLIFAFLYASLALFIAQGFSANNIFFTTFGIMITQSQSESSLKSWRIRSIVGWMMLTGLVLDNAYSGGLASTFTVPKYESSIDTIQDMVDRRLEWGATHDAWIFSLLSSQDPMIKKLIQQFRTYDFETLKKKSFTRELAFSIEKLPAGYFAIGEYVSEQAVRDLSIMLEDFYYEQCIVMARKSSPYTSKLNDHIGRLHESGLLLAWETQIAMQHLNYAVQLGVKLSRSKHDVESVEALSLRQVVGIFIIYGISATFSILTFCGEIIVVRNQKKTIIL
ncbi:glutamate receptor ionotropic, delta-2-like [Leptidea sinapis]|uniref:glutamate receptor ionotropic, delta-2-like n=1 Tax=Leptidea sinapis TaxID=189913 RepID=UPI0021C25AAF|nr:glutamate receptor ionotropic, delta-2-like [Leptidea sinapis]